MEEGLAIGDRVDDVVFVYGGAKADRSLEFASPSRLFLSNEVLHQL
jgi:hypothetical protein